MPEVVRSDSETSQWSGTALISHLTAAVIGACEDPEIVQHDGHPMDRSTVVRTLHALCNLGGEWRLGSPPSDAASPAGVALAVGAAELAQRMLKQADVAEGEVS